MLRKVQYAKFDNAGSGTLIYPMMNAANLVRLSVAKKRADWAGVEAAAEDCLQNNPLDGKVHFELGNAFRQRKMRDHAIFAFEMRLCDFT